MRLLLPLLVLAATGCLAGSDDDADSGNAASRLGGQPNQPGTTAHGSTPPGAAPPEAMPPITPPLGAPPAAPPGAPPAPPAALPTECPSGTATIATLPPAEGLADIAVDASYVYIVSNTGHLSRVSRCTGGVPEPLAHFVFPAPFFQGYLTIDAHDAYAWTNDNTIRKVPLSGGTPTTITVSEMNIVRSVVSDGTFLYFVGSTLDGTKTMGKIPVDGGPLVVLDTTASTAFFGQVTIAGPDLYWVDRTGPNIGIIKKMPRAGGPKTNLWPKGLGFPSSLAVHGDDVFCGGEPGPLVRLPKDGGAPTELFVGATNARTIVSNGTDVYWEGHSFKTSQLWRTPANGDPGTTKYLEVTGYVAGLAAFEKSIFYGVRKTPAEVGTTVTLEARVVRITP